MLSALIPSEHSYPAFALGRTTGTPEVRFSRSSRTEENSPSSILTPTSDRDRQFCYSPLLMEGLDISANLCISLCSSDYIFFSLSQQSNGWLQIAKAINYLRGTRHFCPSLHIAMQFGLYLLLLLESLAYSLWGFSSNFWWAFPADSPHWKIFTKFKLVFSDAWDFPAISQI